MPFAQNIDLVSYHDIGGRPGFKLAMQERGGRFFLYVAALWEAGWTVMEVTEPESPKVLRWIPGPRSNTSTTQVQVADGRMITSLAPKAHEWIVSPLPEPPTEGMVIWDVAEPDNPVELGRWSSGARGTHRNFFAGGRYVHTTTSLPGYRGHLYGVVDILDPEAPELVAKWWWPGQHEAGGEEYTEPELRAQKTGRPYFESGGPMHSFSLHGGAYVSGDRAFCPWMRAGLVVLDVTSLEELELVSHLPVHPPLGSSIAVHSAVPVPSRDLVIINSEALNERCQEPVNFAGVVDLSDERDPMLISLFPQPRVPDGYPVKTFCDKGGRFGPHNQHQAQQQPCLLDDPNYVYLTYFNAGLQIFDISDPRDPFISGCYIPDDPPRRHGPLPTDLVIQVEDVLVDRRGFIYLTEKNSGLYVLQFDPGGSSRGAD